MLNSQFDKIYCINLPHRTDRRLKCDIEFASLGIHVDYFPATDGRTLQNNNKYLNSGEVGAAHSHIRVIEDAKENKYSKILVLEDDVNFDVHFNKTWEMFTAELPHDWDMVYGGVNHEHPPTPISEHVARCNFAFTLHFVGIRDTVYDDILKYQYQYPIDVHYATLHKKYNAYVCIPHVVFQHKGYSDIQRRVVDYEVIKRY